MSSSSHMFMSDQKRPIIEHTTNLMPFHSAGLEGDSHHAHHQLFEHHDLDTLA